ncbi:AAA family ATPase [Saccharopolyspora sp. WRP15-2]|uniref:AAA family ATPase n=1 Tax=Saccharopolyspora oryzae TaxID=2997343 RepID=A0ABT4V8I8_9PSEU|nr:AAA domain-containing protein [Saccharopolyspora oryzae]MDA3630283.1 AAA family ATPase [Saccharopolyspora oryzae]
MAPAGGRDSEALQKTSSLVNYLADLTNAANKNPLRDITSDHRDAPKVIWFDDLPDGIRVDPTADETLLQVRPVRNAPPPDVPEHLRDHIEVSTIARPDGPEPKLRHANEAALDEQVTENADEITRTFDRWLARWRAWAEEARRRKRQRELYEQLESAARELEQKDDEYELVVAVGLVSWAGPNDRDIFRHILVEQAIPLLDDSGTVTVNRIPGKRRLEDRELFDGLPTYHPERGKAHKEELKKASSPLPSTESMEALQEWMGSALDVPFVTRNARSGRGSPLPETLTFSPSPALVLRRRNSALISEAYQRIAEKLSAPDTPVPVALAQLVVNTERHERDHWLAVQGAERGDVLGEDPLFPLPANNEQSRVMELLRTETGIVVQGPPGTGKTHTIANLVSALLAQGQRVLVTSQKDQALRVLRDKIPAEVRKLCVLLAGGSKDAAVELERGLDALSQAVASTDTTSLARTAAGLRAERDRLRDESAKLNARIMELRETEQLIFPAVAPGYDRNLYSGTLASIVQQVRDGEPFHDWMPPVPETAADTPPLSESELIELCKLLADRNTARANRLHQEIPTAKDLPSPADLASLVREEKEAEAAADRAASDVARQLAQLPDAQLEFLDQLRKQLHKTLRKCRFSHDDSSFEEEWVARAVRDRLANRNSGLWAHLLEVREEPQRLQERLRQQGMGPLVAKPDITAENVDIARGWLRSGRSLLDYFEKRGQNPTDLGEQTSEGCPEPARGCSCRRRAAQDLRTASSRPEPD